MGAHSAENDAGDFLWVERAIREALPGLLVEEYGETVTDWCELRSVRRIARALAARVTSSAADQGGRR